MAKRRDQEPIRNALREMKVVEHPKRPGRWLVVVDSEEVETIKRNRISDLQIRKHSKKKSQWAMSLVASEVQTILEMRLGKEIDFENLGFVELLGGSTETRVEHKTKSRAKSNSRQILGEEQRERRRELFRNNLKRWLTFQKMSQREAAERLGMSPRLLQRWAKDGIAQASKRTQENLLRLCQSMGLERIDDLWRPWTPLSTVSGMLTFLQESGQIEAAMKAVSEMIKQKKDVSSGDPRVDLKCVLENTYSNDFASPALVKKVLDRMRVNAPDGLDSSD